MFSPNTSSTAKHEADKFMHSRVFSKVASPNLGLRPLT